MDNTMFTPPLAETIMDFLGTWDASANTPVLSDATGESTGDLYIVSTGGTQDLGSGSITFVAGDWVIYNGSAWERSINSQAVTSVNTETGDVVLDTDDVAEGVTNLYASTVNVQNAGALMDSEVTNLADVKAFDTTDYATAAQGSAADSALQNVVEDLTPQLGGNLDAMEKEITALDAITFNSTYGTTDYTTKLFWDAENGVFETLVTEVV